MAKNRKKLAKLLGATNVDEIPDVGGGAFGMARAANLLHERLTPRKGECPERPTHSKREQAEPAKPTATPLASLHPTWTDELRRRVAEVDSGEVQPIPWEEVQRRIQSKLDAGESEKG